MLWCTFFLWDPCWGCLTDRMRWPCMTVGTAFGTGVGTSGRAIASSYWSTRWLLFVSVLSSVWHLSKDYLIKLTVHYILVLSVRYRTEFTPDIYNVLTHTDLLAVSLTYNTYSETSYRSKTEFNFTLTATVTSQITGAVTSHKRGGSQTYGRRNQKLTIQCVNRSTIMLGWFAIVMISWVKHR